MPFLDLHCDTIARLLAYDRAGLPRSLRDGEDLHINLEKLRQSGYLLQNFALFVNLDRTEDPLQEVLTLADVYWREVEANRDLLVPILSREDLDQIGREGKIGSLLTVEEGAVCKGSLSVLRMLYRLGVRLLTLTWNHENELGHPNGKSGGLTETGFAFLEEMEKLGMLVDVSHLGDDGFWDVCRAAKKPFLDSHSSCRALRNHPRNLTDEMIKALSDRGGLVGVNFYAGFLGESPVSRTEDMVRHLRHLVDVGGLSVAALGSDFDGIDSPLELGDAGGMLQLVEALDQGGFTPREIDAICWENGMRLYREVL